MTADRQPGPTTADERVSAASPAPRAEDPDGREGDEATGGARFDGKSSAVEANVDGREPAIAVEDLTKVYGDGAVTAVDGVSFEIEPGTVVGLLGPNGAGKTTTIKSLLSLIVPTSGRARVFGVDVHENSRRAYRYVAAMLEGGRNVYWRLTVRENLRFFAALAGHHPDALSDRHDELLARFDLDEEADTAVRELSRGMRQKVATVATLGAGADVVVLDEPTLGLDVESTVELRRQLREVVAEEEMTVLVSSHDMDVIEEVCDRVVIMSEGRIVADDTVENLLELFRTGTYRVRVEESIGRETRRALESSFDASEFERGPDGESFLARVTGEEFYHLVDTLRDGAHAIADVDSVEPNLEEVFLHVTNRSADAAEPRGGEASE